MESGLVCTNSGGENFYQSDFITKVFCRTAIKDFVDKICENTIVSEYPS